MLVSNQQLDKLAAAHVDFTSRGMLDGPGLPAHLVGESQDQSHPDLDSMPTVQDKEHDVDAIDGPRSLSEVTLAKSPSTQHSHIVFMIKCL